MTTWHPVGDPISRKAGIPAEYGTVNEPAVLPWAWAADRLHDSLAYWLTTVSTHHAPHAVPIDGTWTDNAFFFGGSREARWMRNLRTNPQASIHLESAAEVLVIEGRAEEVVPDRSLAERLAAAASKYRDRYGPIPADSYIGRPVWALRPTRGYGWTDFPRNATTWLFPDSPQYREAMQHVRDALREVEEAEADPAT